MPLATGAEEVAAEGIAQLGGERHQAQELGGHGGGGASGNGGRDWDGTFSNGWKKTPSVNSGDKRQRTEYSPARCFARHHSVETLRTGERTLLSK